MLARPGDRAAAAARLRPTRAAVPAGSTSSARSSSIRCGSRSTRSCVNSRVAFISITGQFAFRAQFGDKPTFLISAGGFHPRFNDIPSDIPAPFERVGAELRHRHRRRGVQGLLRDHLGDHAGRLVAARVGRRRHRRHRRRLRVRRDLLPRAEVLLRGRHLHVSRRARLRHRLRLRRISTACSPARDAGTSPARAKCTRRGRCPTSRCTSTRRGAPTATRRRSPSTCANELAKEIANIGQLVARSCRRATTASSRSPTSKPADRRARASAAAPSSSSRSSSRSNCAWPRRAAARSSGANEFFGGDAAVVAGRTAVPEREAPHRRAATSSPPRSSSRCRRTTGMAKPSFELVHRRLRAGRRHLSTLGEIVGADARLRRSRSRRAAQCRRACCTLATRRFYAGQGWGARCASVRPACRRCATARSTQPVQPSRDHASTRRRWRRRQGTGCRSSPARQVYTRAFWRADQARAFGTALDVDDESSVVGAGGGRHEPFPIVSCPGRGADSRARTATPTPPERRSPTRPRSARVGLTLQAKQRRQCRRPRSRAMSTSRSTDPPT